MTPDGVTRPLRIIRCGAVAEYLFGNYPRATVAAVFDRSFYIEVDGYFACIGGMDIGDGPLNAIVSDASLSSALACLKTAQIVSLETGAGTAVVCIDAKLATVWHRPAWPTRRGAGDRNGAISIVRGFAMSHAPSDGLARMVMGIALGEAAFTPLLRIASPRFKAFKNWLADARGLRDLTAREPPAGLLGLGPGLTPSGDDVLGALMIALDATGEDALAGRIAATIAEAAPSATSPLSAAFLSAAAEGLGSAALHSFIAAAAGGADEATMLVATKTLAATGHTSGWDAMAGAMLGLEVPADALST